VNFLKHKALLERAIIAIRKREQFSYYPDAPQDLSYSKTAESEAQNNFIDLLGNRYTRLHQAPTTQWHGDEFSAYLQQPMDITYPVLAPGAIIANASRAMDTWANATVARRAAILIESLENLRRRFFDLAHATMHTTGQGYLMAFQASGPHAADRALEAIAGGYEEMTRLPSRAHWQKNDGNINVHLANEWKAYPKGISLVFGCSTFPVWNAVPAIYASLISGNPVIVKPHRSAILPLAILVGEIQNTLQQEDVSVNVCQLAVDSPGALISTELARNDMVRLIDYTGGSEFANYLKNIPGKTVFTEKAGVNSVIIDSVASFDPVARNLAFSLCLYSGQMFSKPQNFFIPHGGINTASGHLTFHEVAQKITDEIVLLSANAKLAAAVFGVISNKKVLETIQQAENVGKVLLKSRLVDHPVFSQATLRSPTVIEVGVDRPEVFTREWLGPVAVFIKTSGTGQSICLAQDIARRHGSITCAAYTTDPAMKLEIAEKMGRTGTPVSFNLGGGVYLNQNFAFSDFHLSGGNPSGSGSFTNTEFVVRRFFWSGFREPTTWIL
jgi:phenylacetic acid degradation protein paaN